MRPMDFPEQLAAQNLHDWLRDLEAVFKGISGRTESILTYLDDQHGILPDGERDDCVADVEAIHREANYMANVIARASFWLKFSTH